MCLITLLLLIEPGQIFDSFFEFFPFFFFNLVEMNESILGLILQREDFVDSILIRIREGIRQPEARHQADASGHERDEAIPTTPAT